MSRSGALRKAGAAVAAPFLLAWPAFAACTPATPCIDGPTIIGTLGGAASNGWGVSGDGQTAVGYSTLASSPSLYHAFSYQGGAPQDLGALGGSSDWSQAYGANTDGSVIVGNSGPIADARAVRWVNGVIESLGTFESGGSSYAAATNGSGDVVVGYAKTSAGLDRAFRWESGTMVDIAALGGTDAASYANDIDISGDVIVGYSTTSSDPSVSRQHAFRWEGGAMVDLGSLNGDLGNSFAYGVSGDGNVVVGYSETATSYHAMRWKDGEMSDLGSLLAGQQSFAMATDGTGAVVVGYGFLGGGTMHAFRWTADTEMQDLNTLLTSAGVELDGITLENAMGVSQNGQIIVGSASYVDSPETTVTRAYIARYYDGTPGEGPIGGVTTPESVIGSLNDLAAARFGLLAQEHGFAAPLLGNNLPMGEESEAGVFATAGSAAGGGFIRYATGYGLNVLAGVSYAQEDYADAELKNSAMGALALQYIAPQAGWWRPFVEAGGWAAPKASVAFERTYANGAGTATGVGRTNGDLGYAYARAGVIVSSTKADQLVASAELGRQWMTVDGYAETFGASNPFEAHVSEGTDQADLVKLGLRYSHAFSRRIDTTFWLSGVHAFNRDSGLEATVAGVGTLTAGKLDSVDWLEYGARVGYRLTDAVTLDLFTNGVSGGEGIDTRIHGGAGLRYRF